jgi:hypothetical protein
MGASSPADGLCEVAKLQMRNEDTEGITQDPIGTNAPGT